MVNTTEAQSLLGEMKLLYLYLYSFPTISNWSAIFKSVNRAWIMVMSLSLKINFFGTELREEERKVARLG